MRVHYLQHVPFEGLGSIENVLSRRGHSITVTRFYEGEALPETGQFEWLVVMGGPMSVHDEREHAWLAVEKRFVAAAIGDGKLVLGICLGAQLIAHVLGARVYPGVRKEIGWFPVERTDAATKTEIGRVFPETVDAFHWHGETFDIPAGAIRLARSQVCDNQAFVFQDRVLALQYHLEATPASATALVENCAHELVEGRYIQSGESMLLSDDRFARINGVMENVLEQLATQI